MRLIIKNIARMLSLVAVAMVGFTSQSCEDEPDKYKVTGGKPTVYYVRYCNEELADSLLVSASTASVICLVGDNMRSIYELYFNDQQAVLTTSLITDNTLIVSVPRGIPEIVTDKMYMITKSKDTVSYDFKVIVPAPAIDAMSCEYAKQGSVVTITGDYFVDNEDQPLSFSFGDVPVTEIKNITKNAVTLVVPEGAQQGSYISATSIYGTSKSIFQYMDPRGVMFEFDGVTNLTNHGWHNRVITTDENAISGNYVQLGDGATAMSETGGWNDSQFSFEYWCGDWNNPQVFQGADCKLTDLVDFTDFKNMAIKFEMCIPKDNSWSAGAMQIIFAGTDLVTLSGNGGYPAANNTFFTSTGNPGWPRALYKPWESSGSYNTNDEWITVTIPINSDFIYDSDGSAATQKLTATSFASFTLFVFEGGVNGTECYPIFKIDNIRAVPYK